METIRIVIVLFSRLHKAYQHENTDATQVYMQTFIILQLAIIEFQRNDHYYITVSVRCI